MKTEKPAAVLEEIKAALAPERGRTVPIEEVDNLVLGTANAPYRRSISAEELAACLASGVTDGWTVHVATFLTEVRPELVLQFAARHGVKADQLAATYRAVRTRTGEGSAALETTLERVAPAP